jgi:uncharacterized membrane protein
MKKTFAVLTLFLFASIVILNETSCTKDVVIQDLCFQKNVLPIFVSKCSMSGCHNSNGGSGKGGTGSNDLSLDNYNGIMRGVTAGKANQSLVYTECAGLFATMPPKNSTQLTRAELSTIKAWINAGAVNSTCGSSSCDTNIYTYSGIVAGIMQSNCVGCHSTTNASGNVDLSSYTAVKNAVANTNYLKCIQHAAGYSAMPRSYQLDNCELSKIEKWVSAGTPNN